MPYERGKFVKPGTASMGKPVGQKPAGAGAKPTTPHEKTHGQAQAPHGGGGEKHVTETHPGKTQPHPESGAHAFHVHHTGEHASGGPAYSTHTHHDDGTVESKENQSHDEMMQQHAQAFPEPNSPGGDMQNEPMGEDKEQYAGMMSGIGGNDGQSV